MSREYLAIILAFITLLGYLSYKKLKSSSIYPNQTITYKVENGINLTLHVFKAKTNKSSGTHPALLFFHGGAWQYGSPKQFYPQCEFFAQHGLSCFSAQYRIKSVHGTDPRDSIQDAQAALNYLHQHSKELNIDPTRIIVAGGSAGGHLAAAIGTSIPLLNNSSKNKHQVRPNALILYNPMLDLSPDKPDHHLVSDYWQDVSPMHNIDKNTPATLILVGTNDPEVPVETVKKFCGLMKDYDLFCELGLYQGATHGFFNYQIENAKYFHATNKQVIRFLGQIGFIVAEGNTQ